MTTQYTDQSIQTLEPLKHIRLRSGMYIGRLGDGTHPDDGCYVMLKEVIDNSIDEWMMGHGKRIDVDIDYEKQTFSVRDYGRGIPLGKVVDCVSMMNTGAKYNDDVFQFSVGLNGVGLKAVNALSEHFIVRAVRDGEYVEAIFSRGELVKKTKGTSTSKNGTFVSFKTDHEIFKTITLDSSIIVQKLKMVTYLNKGLVIRYNGEKMVSTGGLTDLVSDVVGEDKLYDAILFEGQYLQFAFTHSNHRGEIHYSFVNGQYTSDGGTHLSAFREGLVKGINDYAQKSYQAVDVREGLFGALLIKIKEPIFESQTKNKLGNTDIRTWIVNDVQEAVSQYLYKNEQVATRLTQLIEHNQQMRKELSAVRKEVREKQKKISIKIPKLRDCKHHRRAGKEHSDKSMVFIVEGDSAGATMVTARDPLYQAIYSLKGKPLNVHGMGVGDLYKNEQMYNLMCALGVETMVDDLKYEKVIIATDADVDGMHIRNLLLTYFLTFFEELILKDHLYILQTPLFKVRSKKETIYCQNEEEKQKAMAKCGKNAEVTRFKGLGEMSPSEFKRFIHEDIQLKPVRMQSIHDMKEMLSFYMGKNTPQRKAFITENLIASNLEVL